MLGHKYLFPGSKNKPPIDQAITAYPCLRTGETFRVVQGKEAKLFRGCDYIFVGIVNDGQAHEVTIGVIREANDELKFIYDLNECWHATLDDLGFIMESV